MGLSFVCFIDDREELGIKSISVHTFFKGHKCYGALMETSVIKAEYTKHILVIKLGALGDMVQAFPFLKALQQANPQAHITLLTTPPFAEWTKRWGLFQDVWSEPRFPFWRLDKWLKIWCSLRSFDTVIDLQGVDRTRLYGKWRSMISISSHHDLHIRWRLQELADQLGLGELPLMRLPVLSLPPSFEKPYVLLVPGASKKEKCWPQKSFADLAAWLKQRFDVEIVVLSRDTFVSELDTYKHATTWEDIVSYGSRACVSIGNDTGPQLLAAAGGCPTLTFYGKNNPPTRGGPWGGWQLFSPNIVDITLSEVQSLLEQHASTWYNVETNPEHHDIVE